jgi:uncharacterized membrane protein
MEIMIVVLKNMCLVVKNLALLVFTILIATTAVKSAEVITSFHARIELQKNGEMLVTETISVISEGRQIRRGIFRDFPRYYIDEDNQKRREVFNVVSVRRNGQYEPYHFEVVNEFDRVFIGTEDVLLANGAHEFEITYKTNRQVGFFDNEEELYWNVTGNGWAFPIQRASAEIILTEGGRFSGSNFFTGPFGATDKNAIAEISQNGNIATFKTTTGLARQEGLTIVVKMPIGTIDEPTKSQENAWLWLDFGHVIVGVGTAALAFFYYVFAWFFVGRDPKLGRVEQRKTTSLGISPALVHYISNKGRIGASWTAISAAILSLAVKGHITMDKFGGDPVLTQEGDVNLRRLPVGEAAIMRMIAETGEFKLNKDNGLRVAKLKSSFKSAMEDEHRGVFYEHNTMLIVIGILISVMGALATLFFNIDGLIYMIMALVSSAFSFVFLLPVYFLFRWIWRRQSPQKRIVGLLIFSIIALAGIGFAILMLVSFVQGNGSWANSIFVGALIALILLNLTFFHLMGSPTALGAQMMGQIEGLKLHLINFHQQRMNLSGTPDMTPKYFEKQLPYAVALEVEKPWSDAFSEWMTSAEVIAQGAVYYDPYWDRNHHYTRGLRHGTTMTDNGFDFGQEMSQSFSSAMPVPKSSSSGGSSGGGGGGGGGGGW